MAAKLTAASRDLAGFIYAPASLWDGARLAALGERFAASLRAECGAGRCAVEVIQ
jgi:hypothetical protein